MLKANGLTAPSAHVGIEAIETSGTQTFADAKVIGHELSRSRRCRAAPKTTADDWKQVAARFNKAGDGVQGRRIPLRVSQPQRHRAKNRRRAADRHPDEGDGSGARVVRDGHLLGGERRRGSIAAPGSVSGAIFDVPRQGLDGTAGPQDGRRRRGHDRLQDDLRARQRSRAHVRRARRPAGSDGQRRSQLQISLDPRF